MILFWIEPPNLKPILICILLGMLLHMAAATGNGCWWNGKRTHVSTISSFDKAIVTTTDPGNFASYNRDDAWHRIQEAFYYRTGWGDAYGYLLVATGRVELMLDPIPVPRPVSVWFTIAISNRLDIDPRGSAVVPDIHREGILYRWGCMIGVIEPSPVADERVLRKRYIVAA